MPAALRFHGLDEIERGLSRAASELDYIVIDEVLDRKRSVGVARVAFSAEALAPYAEEDEDDEELDLDDEPDDEDLDDGPWSIGERGHPDDEPSLAEATRDDDPAADEQRWLVRAALAWIREEVSGFLTNRPRCTFRLRLYRPKGGQALSKNFKVENPDYHPAQARSAPPAAPPQLPALAPPQLPALAPPQLPALAPPQLPALPPVEPPRPTPAVAVALDAGRQLFYLDPDTIPEARVWRALGRATEELLGTVGRTYTGIIDLQGRTVAHQAEQLDKSQRLVESLATQLLDARQVQREDEAEQRADEQQLRIREELGKTFLSELGSFGRLLATSRLGVAPELAELGDLVAASPELAEAIRDPNVRAMLKDDKTRRELAQLLLIASKRTGPGPGAPSST